MRVLGQLAVLVVSTALAGLAACSSDAPAVQQPGVVSGPTADAGGVVPPSKDAGTPKSTVDAAPPPPRGDHLPCDVDAILEKSCRQCHGATPQFGAPMPLVTYADLTADLGGQPTYTRVAARIHDDAKPMPQPPNPRLDAADTAAIDAWVAAGAPASGDTCAPPADAGPTSSYTPQPLACADQKLRPPTGYTMPTTTDDVYVCYGVDIPVASKRQIIELGPHIDNTKIVHHILLFEADQAYSSTPTVCSGQSSTGWRLVSGWAPGGGNYTLPAEAGFPEDASTHFVLQIHYNNVKHLAGETDSSGFDFCTTDQLRPNDADVMAFGAVNFSIPPHSQGKVACDYTMQSTSNFIYATPHMHQHGTAISSELRPSGGATQPIAARPVWDFGTQTTTLVTMTAKSGDVVHTECDYKNDSNATVSFGEYTEDEMCFVFTAYYPKITSGGFSWITPSENIPLFGTANCQVTSN